MEGDLDIHLPDLGQGQEAVGTARIKIEVERFQFGLLKAIRPVQNVSSPRRLRTWYELGEIEPRSSLKAG